MYKSLLISHQGRRTRLPDFQLSFLKKLYFTITFDLVAIHVYIGQYLKGLKQNTQQTLNDSICANEPRPKQDYYQRKCSFDSLDEKEPILYNHNNVLFQSTCKLISPRFLRSKRNEGH